MDLAQIIKTTANRSINNVLLLIETLATTSKSMSVMEISKFLGVTRATVYSLIKPLIDENYIQKDEDTGKYSIGYKIYELGTYYHYNFPFLNIADKHVAELCSKKNIKINISVLKSPCVAVIIFSRDSYLVPKMVWGYILPAYASSCGKVLLSSLSDKKLRSVLENTELKCFTPNTVTDVDKLMEEIQLVREKGYATEKEEIRLQSCCVAAPIFNRSGQIIAAVSFSGTTSKIMENMEQQITDVKLLASTISAGLGYIPFKF